MRPRNSVQLLIVGCLALGLVSSVGAQHPSAATTEHVRDLTVSDVIISAEHGYVLETHPPAASPTGSPAPIIVYIQEAHVDVDGQHNLMHIIEQLVQEHHLKLVLVEGGEGDVSLAYLRRYTPPEVRKEVAEEYLTMGLISGEEYLDIASDYPLTLWGVEEQGLYDRHVQAYLEVEALQPTLTPVLASVRDAVEALQAKASLPALAELDTKRRAFESEQMELAAYAAWLYETAQQMVPTVEAPQLAQFITLQALEQRLKIDEVQRQQQAMVQVLQPRLSADRLLRLRDDAAKAKAGTLPAERFYANLAEDAASVSLSLDPWPDLATYVHYLTARTHLRVEALGEELDHVAEQLREHLIADSPYRHVYAIADELALIEQMVALKLSPRDYARLVGMMPEQAVGGWANRLNAFFTKEGLPTRTFPGLERVQAALPIFTQFYEVAHLRDEALVQRTMAKLKETGEPLAVLITGGFHAPEIARRLQGEGVGLVAVAPKVGQGTDDALYRAVLKYKSGHGSFEDVKAAAHRTPEKLKKEGGM